MVIVGVQPEAWVLTTMMTAPFTVGIVLPATLGTAGREGGAAAPAHLIRSRARQTATHQSRHRVRLAA